MERGIQLDGPLPGVPDVPADDLRRFDVTAAVLELAGGRVVSLLGPGRVWLLAGPGSVLKDVTTGTGSWTASASPSAELDDADASPTASAAWESASPSWDGEA